jgi:hypothetical protein
LIIIGEVVSLHPQLAWFNFPQGEPYKFS